MRRNIFIAPVLAVLVFCGAAWGGVEISADTFPDENFRDYVSSNFDIDEDGVLSDDEIAAVSSMDVSAIGAYSLAGIEYFTSLVSLDCSNNYLAELDLPESITSASLGEQFLYYGVMKISPDSDYPYRFDMISILTSSDNFSRVHSLTASTLVSSDIEMNISGDILYFADKPLRLSYDYEVRSNLPYMNVFVALKAAPVIITQSLPSGKVGVSYDTTIRASGDVPFYVSVGNVPAGLLGITRNLGMHNF